MAGKIAARQLIAENGTWNKYYRLATGIISVITVSTIVCMFLINNLRGSFVLYRNSFYVSRVQRSADDMPATNLTESWCFANISIMPNGSWFQCPLPGQKPDMTSCCGPKGKQQCCVPKTNKNDDELTQTEVDVITAVSIVAAFVVSISCCLLLYCCCGQRRPEITSGKLILVKRKKYRKSDGTNGEKVETELIDYHEYAKQNHMTFLNENNDSRTKSRSREHLHVDKESSSPPTKHVTSSGHEMTVPLINIQASTPTEPQSQAEDAL